MGTSAEDIIALSYANLRNNILSQHISAKKFASTEIKNTRHSSGLGVNTKSINHIEHDECMMSRQELVRVLLVWLSRL